MLRRGVSTVKHTPRRVNTTVDSRAVRRRSACRRVQARHTAGGGNVYYHAKDFERALADYEMALKLDPLSAIAYFDRGGIYLQLKQIDRAIDDYDQALWLDAGFSNAFAQRGNAWLMKGNFDHAWDDYNRAIEADPRNPYGYVCRGAAAASRHAF